MLVVIVSLILVCVFVGVALAQAEKDLFSLLEQSLETRGLPLISLTAEDSEGLARISAVVQSESSGSSVTADDKTAEEKILRATALSKAKGLVVDELAFTVLNTEGKVIFTMVRPLDVPLDPVWDKAPTMAGTDVEQAARDIIEKDFDLTGLKPAGLGLSAVDDGMRSLDMAFVVTDQKVGLENLARFLFGFYSRMDNLSLEQGAKVGVIHIDADDEAGNPLVRYTIDLQLQHAQGWFAPGTVLPGPSPKVAGDSITPGQAD